MLFDLTDKLVWVAGQHGMVGRAMMRRLEREPCALLLDPGRTAVDLRRQSEVEDWMASRRPRIVFLTAGRVGGLYANDAFPADFLYDNLLIEANIIHAAYRTGVEKLLFFGSSCIYPREAPQPIPESALLMGPLEPTNEAYAVAKIAGIKLCQSYRRQHGCDFISAMPTNLYGPGDNFHPETSHVPAALFRRVAYQYRRGLRCHDCRIRRTHSALRGLRGARCLRHVATGRNAAQAARQQSHPNAGLVGHDTARGGTEALLRLVSVEPGQAAGDGHRGGNIRVKHLNGKCACVRDTCVRGHNFATARSR